ncbi:hypothetical protein [Thalassovita sp.]|uniref:hypothetical protein n=1 Tax=Thalassovita sp. TaxID=1979401 RepID=UPI002B273F05|nr:hypothetical protein [Thalassovita sp.]
MAAIKDVLNGFDDSSAILKEAKAHLDTLHSMATLKADFFKDEIYKSLESAGSQESPLDTPIHTVLDSYIATHAYVSDNADGIVDVIKGAVNDFINGGRENIVNGIASIAGKAVTILLGSSEGSEDETSGRFIAVNRLGGIYRLDYRVWKRSVNSESLKSKAEQVTAMAMYKSTPDCSKMTWDDFLVVFGDSLSPDLSDSDVEAEKAFVKKSFDDLQGAQKVG